jgi:hypothetical protein
MAEFAPQAKRVPLRMVAAGFGQRGEAEPERGSCRLGGDGMTHASEDQVLDALQLGWEGAYEFGAVAGGYWARRRDSLGGTLMDEDPGELRRMVIEDYAVRPLRRRQDHLHLPPRCSA